MATESGPTQRMRRIIDDDDDDDDLPELSADLFTNPQKALTPLPAEEKDLSEEDDGLFSAEDEAEDGEEGQDMSPSGRKRYNRSLDSF
jgi:hypothetical protein